MSNPYSHLEALGLQLISAGGPVGNFVPCVQVGSLVFLSGQGPRDHDGTLKTGKFGQTLSVEQGRSHAQLAGLNVLSMLYVEIEAIVEVRD
jgi:enamine deaminase RidA (YjgF/YER057c/UK114 family)